MSKQHVPTSGPTSGQGSPPTHPGHPLDIPDNPLTAPEGDEGVSAGDRANPAIPPRPPEGTAQVPPASRNPVPTDAPQGRQPK